MRNRKLLCGVGINDADYLTVKHEIVDGKRKAVWVCPFYSRWAGMIERCYSAKELKRHPTYAGCSVCDEWLTFSNFRNWMAIQEWQGKDLDKDLLVKGNKVYSPETCLFMSRQMNTFLSDCAKTRGSCPIGVSWSEKSKRYNAYCRDPIEKRKVHLGSFTDVNEAAKEWLRCKMEFAMELADLEKDEKVANALRARFKQ